MNDSTFLTILNNREPRAFDELYRRYYAWLCATAARQLGQFIYAEDPDDPVTSVMGSVWTGISTKGWRFENINQLTALLGKVLRHKVVNHINYFQAKKRGWKTGSPADADQFPSREPSPAEIVATKELIEQTINAVVQGLNDLDREVFRLRLEGKTRKKIAEVTGCTEAAVRVKLDRLKARLTMLLKDAH